MIKQGKISTATTRILLIAILPALLASPVWGQQPERVKVLIAFGHRPGPAEEALVRGMGGSVKYTYHLVPAIAATLPEPAVSALAANPRVTRVEPDRQMRALDIELDNAWGVTRIGAGTVHEGGNKGAGVKLAIIDSGINYDHPDLNDNYAGGYDFVQLDEYPMDVYGHGTHVAGTACAEDNGNGDSDGPYGVVGVAPACALYALRVLDDAGFGDASDLIAAMQWAVDNGVQVANLSLGWDLNPGDTVKAAFDNAEDAGLVIVAAACNNGNRPGRGDNVCYPALYDSVIAVAATDDNDRRASFSSTGAQVELAAPGVSVFSTWNDDTGYLDPQPVCRQEEGIQACYKYGSGTSMAAPHVAGTAALILDANPDWSNVQVRAQLQATADDVGDTGWDPQYGWGLVDAAEAAPAPANNPPVVEITSPDDGSIFVSGSTIDFQGTASDAEEGDLTAGLVWVSNLDGEIGTGDSVSSSLGDGSHTITASVTDSGGQTGRHSISIMVGSTSEPTTVSVGGFTYATTGGRDGKKHLSVTVALVDELDNPVAGAPVSIRLNHESGNSWTFTSTTGSEGAVAFSLANAPSGCYTTTVTSVTAGGLTWDAGDPGNVSKEFCK
ncbi:MAG: S8 family serine peptidase [Anaerolineae bacterium]|jgi:subtilisin